ncbi:nucleoside 2-deoxyribosyltransferase [Blastomonas sp. CCH1-A6]|uniref:nucleoside 2-deoxyribosyltransferase n=1 Tax=Blastomonas sp. CCH1-A6 TaxID=1768762 RepID=UPI000A6A82BE
MADNQLFAFVLMPFDNTFDDIYKLGIQQTCKEHSVLAERVDEQIYSETILERIYRQIDACDFIIADMSGRNPNVFYEVGYAHAKGKLCTLLTQSTDDIPFDLRHHRHIVYDGSITKLKSQLSTEIDWLKSEISRKQKQPLSIELNSSYGELFKNEYTARSEIDLVFDIHNKSSNKAVEIEAMYLHTHKNWTFQQQDRKCDSAKVEGDEDKVRHLITPPLQRMPKGSWAQIKVKGIKNVWTRSSGTEVKDKYVHSGRVAFELFTSQGNFQEFIELSVESTELPF